ncbi:MAG: hypothetical protein GY793_04245 [Proteobacteria bacterium]|nr:hypothetical protein [Pseudomonadota bacterium]
MPRNPYVDMLKKMRILDFINPNETYQEMLDLVSSIRRRFTIIQNVSYHNNDKIRNKIVKESNSKVSTVTTGFVGSI